MPVGFTLQLKGLDQDFWDNTLRLYFDQIGHRLRSRIQRGIYNQILDWEPLSEQYAQWKEEQGFDPRVLIATQEYVGSIISSPIPFGITVRPIVGTHSMARVSYMTLAEWLEYGTDKMPARPHWRPIILEFETNELPAIKQKIHAHLAQKIRHRLHKLMVEGMPS